MYLSKLIFIKIFEYFYNLYKLMIVVIYNNIIFDIDIDIEMMTLSPSVCELWSHPTYWL